MKKINTIVASATPPSDSNVMWLDTSSGFPILMFYHRGQWMSVVAPAIYSDENE